MRGRSYSRSDLWLRGIRGYEKEEVKMCISTTLRTLSVEAHIKWILPAARPGKAVVVTRLEVELHTWLSSDFLFPLICLCGEEIQRMRDLPIIGLL
jgi:hypothetical protein